MLRHRLPTEPARPAEVRRWVLQTSAGVTATLDRLERAGRLVRLPDPHDGRSVRIDLTEDGERFYDHLLEEVAESYELTFARGGAAEALHAVRRLIAAFEVAGQHDRTSAWSVTPT